LPGIPDFMKMAAFKVAAFDRFSTWKKCYPGGNAMNQSVRFKQMGWEASFVGALGTDREGELLFQALTAYGIDCSCAHKEAGKNASNILLTDEAGERFEAPDAWQGGVYETYRLSAADWAHLAKMELWVSHANHNDYLSALEKKAEGQFFAADFLHLKDMELLTHSLGALDIAFFGGTKDMEPELAKIARERRALIVLTLGAEGSVAFCGEKVFRQEALSLEKVADTTGCGDAFQAGFTNSFYRFKDVPRALLDGALLGKTAASSVGALPWPTPEMEAFAFTLF
jgi:fructoselysine 6-kinase